MQDKSLMNTPENKAKKNVSDLQTYGPVDSFQLLFKASSAEEGWMKSTKAMEINGIGCVVQVTTQQDGNVAEAITFVPNVRIQDLNKGGRKLISLYSKSDMSPSN